MPPAFPGYADDVKSAREFAKCGVERRMAILNSLTRLMELYTRNLERADARLAEAAKAVAREEAEIAEEKAFLATVMSTYVEFAQVIAADAASAIEARRVETEGLDAKHESAAPKADAQEGS
jgi:hypothetical protein